MPETIRDPDRRCDAPGCTTTLSRYNSDHLCFRHADEATRVLFERRSSNETRSDRYRQTAGSAIQVFDPC